MDERSKKSGIPDQAKLRIRPDKIGWVLEVGKERSFQGSATGFSWKRWGYYNRIEGAVRDGLDAALHEGGDYGEIRGLRDALEGAQKAVEALVAGIHRPS